MLRTGKTRPRAAQPLKQGFTLIELMVVLMVMAILSTAIVPSLVAAMKQTGARSAATRVRDLLEFASTAAIARRQAVTVAFDVDRRACWVSVRRTRLPWRQMEAEEDEEKQTLVSLQFSESVQMAMAREMTVERSQIEQSSADAIRFWSDVTAETAIIEISEPEGATYLVGVVGTTGEVKLVEAEEEP